MKSCCKVQTFEQGTVLKHQSSQRECESSVVLAIINYLRNEKVTTYEGIVRKGCSLQSIILPATNTNWMVTKAMLPGYTHTTRRSSI